MILLKRKFLIIIFDLIIVHSSANHRYKIGVGMFDVTGPATGSNLVGYGKFLHDSCGIHFRLYSRAFIVEDASGHRLCYIVADLCMIGQLVRIEVLRRLSERYSNLYTAQNLMISATHTHSGPGGYLQYSLYNFPSLGFDRVNFDCIVNGIVNSVDLAHNHIKSGYIYYNEGHLFGSNINRSPAAYLQNPEEERKLYDSNLDTVMQLLKFTDLNDNPIGSVNWYPVHGTSMTASNCLISGDNKGYAAILLEQAFSPDHRRSIGQEQFVAGFANSNTGDVSPNTNGPRCTRTDLACDNIASRCSDEESLCVSSGPGSDQFESTRMIGKNQYLKAKELFNGAVTQLNGAISTIDQFVDMSNYVIQKTDGTQVKTCSPALGYSFGAGTTDGPGEQQFRQGETVTNSRHSYWNIFRNVFLGRLSAELVDCHHPKPILLEAESTQFPTEWLPSILPTQIFRIADLFVIGLPAELTTMAGRRLKRELMATAQRFAIEEPRVILAAYSNAYSSYVTTYEEYQLQRYEAASTLFGPHTLDAYIQHYNQLMTSLLSGLSPSSTLKPDNYLDRMISVRPHLDIDCVPLWAKFGDCLLNVKENYVIGDKVVVKFSGGRLRNNQFTSSTYLTIERWNQLEGRFETMATDADLDTKIQWEGKNNFFGCRSSVTITWHISDQTKPGIYLIKHYGYHRNIFGRTRPYVGESNKFNVLHA